MPAITNAARAEKFNDPAGYKTCTKCLERRPVGEFHPRPKAFDGLNPQCKPCRAAYQTAYFQTPKGLAIRQRNDKKQHVRRLYGLALDDYEAMCRAQGGLCALCGKPNPGKRKLAVDHCHATGVVRALLCSPCNTGLGYFRDDVSLLRAAAGYLEKHQ